MKRIKISNHTFHDETTVIDGYQHVQTTRSPGWEVISSRRGWKEVSLGFKFNGEFMGEAMAYTNDLEDINLLAQAFILKEQARIDFEHLRQRIFDRACPKEVANEATK